MCVVFQMGVPDQIIHRVMHIYRAGIDPHIRTVCNSSNCVHSSKHVATRTNCIGRKLRWTYWHVETTLIRSGRQHTDTTTTADIPFRSTHDFANIPNL
jgi:hypothetical protein